MSGGDLLPRLPTLTSLLSRDTAYRVRSAITVAEITRTVRRIPVEVPLDAADGMPVPCVVNLDTLLTVPEVLLDRRMATLRPEKPSEVHTAIRFALDLPSLPSRQGSHPGGSFTSSIAFTRGRAHTSPVAAPTLAPVPHVCPTCGDPNLVGVRCTFEQPSNDCEDIGSPHIRWGCTNCPSHWVEPTSGRCCSRRR